MDILANMHGRAPDGQLSYLEPPALLRTPSSSSRTSAASCRITRRGRSFTGQTNREVQLHECRSACTMALGLPNVCVFPDSLLKFHQAYNWETKVRDLGALGVALQHLSRSRAGRVSAL